MIWEYFINKGLTAAGVAGLMGNLYAESGLNPKNLQNSFEKKLGYTDSTYTEAVDNGNYTNFAKDGAGYGLAQWTYHTRKSALQQFATQNGKSIGDLNMQLDFLYHELSTSYKNLLTLLKKTKSVKEASDAFLTQFERPADQGTAVKNKRYNYAQEYYNKYAGKEVVTLSNTNSSLVTYKRITKNKSTLSSKKINRISIHCYVGQVTAKQGVDYFATTSNQASANYVVGYDGSIGLSVEEKDRSWCTSSRDNDKQAVTIEVASGKSDPYQVTDAAYASLLDLVTDICQRNGKTKVIWIEDKATALAYTPKDNEVILTVHRWFSTYKSCPGQYLYERHAQIAKTVTNRLNKTTTVIEEEEEVTQEQFNTMMNTWINEQAKKDASSYSAEARTWAEKNGLISGNSSGQKMYKKQITREEFIVVLYRFVQLLKKSLE